MVAENISSKEAVSFNKVRVKFDMKVLLNEATKIIKYSGVPEYKWLSGTIFRKFNLCRKGSFL